MARVRRLTLAMAVLAALPAPAAAAVPVLHADRGAHTAYGQPGGSARTTLPITSGGTEGGQRVLAELRPSVGGVRAAIGVQDGHGRRGGAGSAASTAMARVRRRTRAI